MSAQFFNRMIYTFTERDIRRAAQQGEMTEYLQKSQNLNINIRRCDSLALSLRWLSHITCVIRRENFVQLSF